MGAGSLEFTPAHAGGRGFESRRPATTAREAQSAEHLSENKGSAVRFCLGHKLIKLIKKFFNTILYDLRLKTDKTYKLISSLYEQINIENYQKNIILHKNTFVRYGNKTFSQSDEDGLIEEIILRINPKNKLFFEMGVGDGTECNTINLLTKKWKGVWIDSNKNQFKYRK